MHYIKNQVVPETPFTSTLSFFKQHHGSENSPPIRRRNTALPQELTQVAEDVAESKTRTGDTQRDTVQPALQAAYASKETSALEDLEAMVQSNDNVKAAEASVQQDEDYVQIHAVEGQVTNQDDVAAEASASDDQKQLILYPQHPAFINAIGMIPATVFWMTAAPVVKYTGVAVEMLIDQLRDTFL